MKKFIVLLALLSMSIPCMAANWQELSYKMYVDTSSFRVYGNYTGMEAWTKTLNHDNLFRKDIWYVMSKLRISCDNMKYSFGAAYAYDKAGKHAFTDSYGSETADIIPGTVSEEWADMFCGRLEAIKAREDVQ